MNSEGLAQRKVLSFKVGSFLLHLECVMARCGQLFQGPVQEVCLDHQSLEYINGKAKFDVCAFPIVHVSDYNKVAWVLEADRKSVV